MKILFSFIALNLTIGAISFSQTSTFIGNEIQKEVKDALYPAVESILYRCCKQFQATEFYWGRTTISKVTVHGSDELRIDGMVSYHGNHCNYEINTDYYVTLNPENGSLINRCINTPTCFMGMETGNVVDCNCTEYMTTEQKADFVNKNGPIIMKFLNSK